jgi:hypothetical protein
MDSNILAKLSSVPIYFLIEEHRDPWQDSCFPIWLEIIVHEVEATSVAGRSLHGECLATSCLPVRKDANIHAIQCCLNKWLDFLENFLLALLGQVNLIEVIKGRFASNAWVVQFQGLMLHFCLDGLRNDLLREHHRWALSIAQGGSEGLHPTKHAHITFQRDNLLLLNLPNLLVLHHVILHVFETGAVPVDFVLELLVFQLHLADHSLLVLDLLESSHYLHRVSIRHWGRTVVIMANRRVIFAKVCVYSKHNFVRTI